jgi:hypothetical protein
MRNVVTHRMGLWILCLFAVVGVALIAQSVDGKWVGEVQGGRGPQPVTLTLKADGGKLTGSLTGGRGGEVTIDNGTISGNTLKFQSKQQGRAGEVVLNWTGTLKGDEIAMSRMAQGREGQPQEFTLKREK